MFRGSTPLQEFVFEFDIAQFVEDLLVTYKQDDIVFEKALKDGDVNGNIFSFSLTQEETLSLDANMSVYIQAKVKTKNGQVLVSDIISKSVNEVLNDKVL